MVHAHNLSYEFPTLTGTIVGFCMFLLLLPGTEAGEPSFSKIRQTLVDALCLRSIFRSNSSNCKDGKKLVGKCEADHWVAMCFSGAFLKMPASTSAYVNVQSQEVNP